MGVGLRTYGDALDFLFARTTGIWRLGLDRIEAFLHSIGDPQRRIRTLHVAGTNGKGSVCATLEAVLRRKGLRTGLYTSPHLVDFRERFLVEGVPVAPERIVEFVERWTPEVERLGATFFEATTAMAFDFFAADHVDVAVIETGLGGRLDATNVVTPMVAGVTSIALDHVEYLGATREEIAFEKAGIFKPGVPAVVGERDPHIRALLAAHAREHGARPVRVISEDLPPSNVELGVRGTSFTIAGVRFTTPLLGVHQAENAATAFAMLELLPDGLAPSVLELHGALEHVRLPGRFHRVGKYLFDVAHNPAGAETLARTLSAVGAARPVVAVLSVLSDKDWRGIMRALAPVVDRFILTNAPTAPPSRAWNTADPLQFAVEQGWRAEVVGDFDLALQLGSAEGATVLVTGSFHTVGDAMTRLEVSPTGG